MTEKKLNVLEMYENEINSPKNQAKIAVLDALRKAKGMAFSSQKQAERHNTIGAVLKVIPDEKQSIEVLNLSGNLTKSFINDNNLI